MVSICQIQGYHLYGSRYTAKVGFLKWVQTKFIYILNVPTYISLFYEIIYIFLKSQESSNSIIMYL